MAQSVERRLGKAEVTGSIPVSSFWYKILHNKMWGFSFCGRYKESRCCKMKKLFVLVCVAICMAGLCVVTGCNMDMDSDFSEEETTHFAEPDLIRHKVGEVFESEYFIITYTSAKQVESVNDGKYKPLEGKVFYQLELTIESKVDEEKNINYNCFIGFADNEVVDQFYFTDNIIMGNLAKAGDKVTGTLTYSVPENAEKIEVIYQYDMFNEEKIAFTVK